MNDTSDVIAAKSSDTVWHEATITRPRREQRNGHKGAIIWLTGLSGSGKSTLAHALEDSLFAMRCNTYVCDGDNIRHGLCGDLGFSPQDRVENIRRIGEVVKLFIDAGVIAMTAFISPYRADRDRARKLVAPGNFIEVYCECAIDVCEQRDVKGLYRRARAGEIKEFTGISAPYEEPENPELRITSGTEPVASCVQRIIDHLVAKGVVPA